MDNPNRLMIFGSYRSNAVDENSILYNRIQSLLGKCDKFHFAIAEIDVPSFDVVNVNKMVMSMLSIDDEETIRDLAGICYERTQGNPFFLLQYMRVNFGLVKWRPRLTRLPWPLPTWSTFCRHGYES